MPEMNARPPEPQVSVAQPLFTLRFFVQWVASERARKSVA